MSRNPDAQIVPAHGLAVIVWCALDVDTWQEFGARVASSLQAAVGKPCAPRDLRRFIRSLWPQS